MAWSKSTFLVLGLILVLVIILRSFFLEVLWVQTDRFAPLLLPGDLVLSFRGGNPLRGDFVRHTCPKRPFCLSQIVGLPGDRVDQRAERVLAVNDRPWSSDFLIRSDAPPLGFDSLVVPPNQYFVLGDQMGLEAAANINSVFNRILFSVDGSKSDVRWKRIGKRTH